MPVSTIVLFSGMILIAVVVGMIFYFQDHPRKKQDQEEGKR